VGTLTLLRMKIEKMATLSQVMDVITEKQRLGGRALLQTIEAVPVPLFEEMACYMEMNSAMMMMQPMVMDATQTAKLNQGGTDLEEPQPPHQLVIQYVVMA